MTGAALFVSRTNAQSALPNVPRKILFVGDSFTYAQGGIYSHFEKLAAAADPPLVVTTDKAVAGGAFLKRLWDMQEPVKAIDTGVFDVVVLQDDIPETNVDYFRQYARMFVDEVRKNKGRPILFMAWAYQRLGWISMQEIAQAHRTLAKELNVEVAPVGLAWQQATKARPDLDLYAADREHPSAYGTYLATCVVYATIYGRDPTGLRYVPSGITSDQAAFLQKVAWQTVQDYKAGKQAENESPSWVLQGSFPDPGGNTVVDRDGRVTVPPRTAAATPAPAPAGLLPRTPGCSRSPVCGNRLTPGRQSLQRVEWEQTLGYTFTYPYVLPAGAGGVPSVALDSSGNLWVFQRKAAGSPQLYKFDPDHKLILQIGDDVIGHQDKAHGMAVDAENNVWIADANGATVMKLSPSGELLMTLGTRGRRGDWNEAQGQRLLWQPVMIAFGKNGDVYIGEGHADESPNDTDSGDPANTLGAARVIHLDRNGRFIQQWYGNSVGQGKFDSVHGLAVDPESGDVWIGDREQYRIVVYTADGKFLRTMQMRNLVCALQFDAHGNPWMASGQDGQFLKLDRNGKVLGAIGNGMGIGAGQFIEASYWVFDQQNNLYAGDTSVGRVTKMVAPEK